MSSKIILRLLVALFIISLIILGFSINLKMGTAVLLGGINLIIAARHHRCFPVLAFSLFNLPIFFETLITESSNLNYYFLIDEHNLPIVLLIQAVCLLPLLFLKPLPRMQLQPFIKGNYFFLLLIMTSFLLIQFGIRGSFAFGNYQAYRDNLATGNGLIEYILMGFVVMAAFKLSRLNKFLFATILLFYMMKCAALGFRVQAIMCSLLFVYLFMQNLSTQRFIMMTLIGAFVGLSLGVLKHSTEYELLSLVLNGSYFQTPHNGALTSATVGLSEISPSIVSVITSPLAMIFPRGFIGDLIPWAYPMAYLQQYSNTPGGMLFGLYGYFNYSIMGPFIVGAIIAVIAAQLRKPITKMQNIMQYAALAFFIFVPRWSLYDFGAYGVRTYLTTLILLIILVVLFTKPAGSNYIGK